MNKLVSVKDRCSEIRYNNGSNIIGYMRVPGSSFLYTVLPNIMYMSTRAVIPVNLRNGLKLLS